MQNYSGTGPLDIYMIQFTLFSSQMFDSKTFIAQVLHITNFVQLVCRQNLRNKGKFPVKLTKTMLRQMRKLY